jgi:hypothetical protein
MRRIPWHVIAAWLYMLSIVSPAVITQSFGLFERSHDEYMTGIQCIFLGWVYPPWYANLALGLGVIGRLFAWRGLAMVCGFVALGLAGTTFWFKDITPFVGFYVWLAAMVAFAVGTIVTFLERPTPLLQR